ncbi:short chain dehydrogenase, putative [Bodo saltans]|uniref:3-oxoacyl-[acyl-carrier-protein] reductase n=1 Tax=Bodo saltans TaxID=75058 RepID=A0A0S4JPJ0_BODSA|nr:short chain dehydrogenase, putative [Bodo saltans]|eukprot:CUG91012.1 short chain dehydrogenase, putative [Bodo saltans]
MGICQSTENTTVPSPSQQQQQQQQVSKNSSQPLASAVQAVVPASAPHKAVAPPTLYLGLKGKLVIVTGSTKGIGYAIATGFARHGALVVVNGRTQAAVEKAATSIAKATNTPAACLFPIAGDLSKKSDFDVFVAKVDKIGVPVEVLVNNHGIFDFKPFTVETDEEWQNYFDVNVLSQVRLSRHYLPGMLERKTGRILFSSSGAAVTPLPIAVAYSVSKVAQVALARSLAELTKGTEVTVNSVLIGPTASEGATAKFGELAAASGANQEQFLEGFLASMPSYALNRLATSEETANIFLFLASKQGLLINGTSQRADAACIRYI